LAGGSDPCRPGAQNKVYHLVDRLGDVFGEPCVG